MKMLISIILLCVSFCAAQDSAKKQSRPDFSGKWILQAASTKPSNVDKLNDEQIEILYSDPELKIITKKKINDPVDSANQLIYYTDGRGDSNGAYSVTKWNGKKLITKYPKLNMQVVRELSEDGSKMFENIITVKIKINMFGSEETKTNKSESKGVYIRQQ